jgi:hypothetical protein
MATPKQVRTRGRFSLLLGAILATVLFAAVAYADNVQNDAGTTTGVTTITEGGSTVITYRIVANNANGDVSGCNADATHPVTISITKSANVSGPSSLSFTACGNPGAKTATFSSSTAGSYPITHAISGGVSGSVFNNQANFILTVNPPVVTNTPPTLTLPSDITASATGPNGAVVNYTASASDVEDGSIAPACSPASGSTFPLGITQVNCSATDSDGETTSGMFNVNVVDTNAPSITATVSPPANANGWHNSPVTVSFTCSDNESGILSCTAPVTLNSEGAGQSASGTAMDNGGNSATVTANGINIDLTAPVINASVSPTPNAGGWNNSNVTVSFTCSDILSGIDTCPADVTVSDEGTPTVLGTAFDNAGNSDTVSVTVKLDKTAPVISGSRSPAANAFGWNNESVDVNFTCNDALSGVASCGPDDTLSSEGANQSVSGVAVDNAGNSSGSETVSNINIDLTDPSVSLVGGPAAGGSYYFGSVPAAPTCSASDALSGLNGSCSVTGYGTGVGSHTVSASAADKAGNTASDSHSYNVLAWTLRGFYQPVDMGTSVVNTVKNGSTVPLKFEIFAGSNELTDTANVQSLTQQVVSCGTFTGDAVDEIETTSTGGTTLRYDTTAGQFIYNWKTPAQPTKCYIVKMTTDDGSVLSAQFKLK